MRTHANWKEGAGRKVLAALLSASLVMQGLPTAALAEAADVDVATEATDEALDTLEATATLDAQALAERVRSAAAEDASQEELAHALVEALAGEELPADKETAQAFAEAARALGLESEAVEGADGSAWNLVCVDGAWYHADVVRYVAEREALGEEEAAAQWLFVSDEAMVSHEGRGSWVLADDAEAEVPAAPANLADALMLAADEDADEQAEPEVDEQTDTVIIEEATEPKAAEEQVEPKAAEEQVEPEVTEEATEPEVAEELPESEDVAVPDESEEAQAEVEEVADVDQAEPTATEPANVESAPELAEDTALEEPLYAEGNVPIKVRFHSDYDRAHEMLSLVNSSRAAAGVGSLGWDYALEQYAVQRAGELVLRYEHFRPDGSAGWANEAIASYKPGCWGQENLQRASWAMSTYEMNSRWDNHAGHRNTRRTGKYTCYAAAIVEVDGMYWMVEAFSTGSPSNSYFKTGNNVFDSVWVQLNSAYTSMHMSPDEVTVNEGQTTTSTPYVCNSYQSSDVFSWKVANPSIASVTTADGPLKIKGLSAGTTTITGTAAAGSVSLKVTVKGTPATSVSLNKTSLSMSPGTHSLLSATVYPSNASSKSITWSSSNTSVATVSNGTVAAVNPGTATITARTSNGKTATCRVTVNAYDMSGAKFKWLEDMAYTGSAVKADPQVAINNSVLRKDVDYTLSYRNNVAVGTATITATGKGWYKGSISSTFTIYPVKSVPVRIVWQDANNAYKTRPTYIRISYFHSVDTRNAEGYIGGKVENSFVPVSAEKNWLCTIENLRATSYDGTPADFSVGAFDVDDYTQEVTGSFDTGYTITLTSTKLPSVARASVLAVTAKFYTGSPLTQDPSVNYAGTTLKNGTDYTISYTNNVNVGTATMTITGKGTYVGVNTVTFSILKAQISKAKLSSIAAQSYTGSAVTPKPTVTFGGKTLNEGTDYTLSYSNNTSVGTATVTITGKGNFTGTKSTTFVIEGGDIAKANVSGLAAQTYSGSAFTPKPTVTLGGKTLANGMDYALSYVNNTNAGTATVTITGKGNYTGTKTASFTINRKVLPSNAVTLSATSYTYDGKVKSPTVTVKDGTKTLVANTDYTLTTPSGRTNAGTYTYTVTGKGNYTGTASASFTITKPQAKDLSSCTVTLSNASYTYDGKVKSPTVTVKDGTKTLTAGVDYTLTTPSGRTNAGAYTYTVTGKGSYTGTATAKLTIKPASIANAVVDMATNVLPADGEPTSKLTLGGKTLKKGTDYVVTYDGVPYADFWGYFGSHTATFTGKGNYTGTVSADFLIQMADLGTITYRIDWIPDQAYTGSAIMPHVSVYKFLGEEGEEALVQGTDYTVSYRNNVQVGTATAIVTGTGRYTGTREITFTIVGTDGRFPDVRQGSWYYNVVNRAAALGLVSGYANGNFGPNNNVTRGQVAVMLWNMAGRPSAYSWKQFPDVEAGAYYYEAVKWAAGGGVVHGYGDGTYRPDDLVTREQLATMLANYAKRIGWLAVEGSADDYAGMYDAGNVSGYARQAVGWCFRNGIISGKADGSLDPQGHATRAETAKMLVFFYDMLQ